MSDIRSSQAAGSKPYVRQFHVVLGVIGLALLGAGQVQAAPSANGALHAVTGMEHANYHATKNCGNAQVMTPQPGTDLMPVDVDTSASPDVEAFYERAARQQVTWLDTVECKKTNKTHVPIANTTNSTAISNYSTNWSGWQIGGNTAAANHYVQAGWNVPVVSKPTAYSSSNGQYYSSIWPGRWHGQ